MWLQLFEKNRKHPSFGVSGKKMCVFDGKTWAFGRMLGHSVKDLKLEQTLYALRITNNTKMGQGKNRGRKRGNAHKPNVSLLHNGYSYRENEEIHSDSSSNSDEEDGSENENDLVSSSNKFFLKQ